METIEDLAAGIVGSNRSHITAYGLTSRIHLRNDEKLRIGSEQHHRQHQDSLRNNRPVMNSGQHRYRQKDQPADKSDPVKTHQRTADDQPRGVNTGGRSGKQRRQFAERDGRQHSAKENQCAQPKAKHQVDQRMEEGSHVGYMGARPVSRSIRRAIGGWVEKRLAKLAPLIKGATINKCAVEAEACMGSRLE